MFATEKAPVSAEWRRVGGGQQQVAGGVNQRDLSLSMRTPKHKDESFTTDR